GVERHAVQVVLQDVLDLHFLRRERARDEIALRVRRRADAHVPVGVDHAVLGERAVRGYEVLEIFHQSAFMFAALTTRVQRSSSRLTRSPRAWGVPPSGCRPCFSSTSRTAGSRMNWFSDSLSCITIGCGVPAGANIAYQVSTSRSGMPASLSVGTSGNASARFALITASMRRRPACTCGATVCSAEIMACTCPPTRSAIAPAAPL